MRSVGIVGGLGPLAGAHFYLRLIQLTRAEQDQDQLKVILISEPAIPSRQDHLNGSGPSPVAQLVAVAQALQAAGAELIAVPSGTTHAYFKEIEAAVDVPVLNLVHEVAAAIAAAGHRRPAIAATTATAKLRLFDSAFGPAVDVRYPDEESQREIMSLIARMRDAGDVGRFRRAFAQLVARPWAAGADCLVLGCTDLTVLRDEESPLEQVDATDVLALAVLAAAGAPCASTDARKAPAR